MFMIEHLNSLSDEHLRRFARLIDVSQVRCPKDTLIDRVVLRAARIEAQGVTLREYVQRKRARAAEYTRRHRSRLPSEVTR